MCSDMHRTNMQNRQTLVPAARSSSVQNPTPMPTLRRMAAPRQLRYGILSRHTLVGASTYTAVPLTVRWAARRGRRHLAAFAQAGRGGKGGGAADEEPDWEAEMSIFKQRISRPNQLATLRELEARVPVGKVLYGRDGLAVVSGLNSDAPLGTKVAFATGAAGVLLWHRSDHLSFCLVLGDPSSVVEGTPVECKIKGVLQVVDDVAGPITRKDFQLVSVPAGEHMFGRVHDHIGRHTTLYDRDGADDGDGEGHAASEGAATGAAAAAAGGAAADQPGRAGGSSSSVTAGDAATSASVQARGGGASSSSSSSSGSGSGGSGGGPTGRSVTRPLLANQVEMCDREQISEPLLTGVKCLDVLTPLGRGASLLLVGPSGAGKTRLALDVIAGVAAGAGTAGAETGAGAGTGAAAGAAAPPPPPGGPVRCVLALVGRPEEEIKSIVSELRSRGSLRHTAVVAAGAGAPLGHQLAALGAACAIGERIRDEGGHALVVVDDIRPLSDVWEQLLAGLAGLGPALLRAGLVKDERGRDPPLAPPPSSASAAAAAAAASPPPTSPPTAPSPSAAQSPATTPQPSPSSSPSEAASSSPPPPPPAAVPSEATPAAGPSEPAAAAAAAAAASTPGEGGRGAGSSSSGAGGSSSGQVTEAGGDPPEELVEYEGMLVSGAVAQRRGFLSTFFLRAAKVSRAQGGGSLSLLPLVPGSCATGVSRRLDLSKYKTLSPEQLAKLEAAFRAQQLAEELSSGACCGPRCELATEVVEEFISIADGQLVLQPPAGSSGAGAAEAEEAEKGSCSSGWGSGSEAPLPSGSPSSSPFTPAYVANPKLSLTRIGTRAYCKAFEQLAPQVRLQLVQADDARRFAAGSSSTDSGSSSGSSGPSSSSAGERADAAARRLAAALTQEPGRPEGLAEQVATLYAVQRGYLDAVPPDRVPAWLRGALPYVRRAAPEAMQELGRTGILTAAAEAGIAQALRSFGAQWRQ